MKRFFILAAVALAAAFGATEAQAGGKANPFNGTNHGYGGGIFHKQPLPAFQAAPWYLYFPYNAHFQTPSPMYNAPWYGPPSAGYGSMVNPYFPAPAQPAAPAPAPVAPAPMK
jgi:hypothetical protein